MKVPLLIHYFFANRFSLDVAFFSFSLLFSSPSLSLFPPFSSPLIIPLFRIFSLLLICFLFYTLLSIFHLLSSLFLPSFYFAIFTPSTIFPLLFLPSLFSPLCYSPFFPYYPSIPSSLSLLPSLFLSLPPFFAPSCPSSPPPFPSCPLFPSLQYPLVRQGAIIGN